MLFRSTIRILRQARADIRRSIRIVSIAQKTTTTAPGRRALACYEKELRSILDSGPRRTLREYHRRQACRAKIEAENAVRRIFVEVARKPIQKREGE